ncbi:MAG: hypothetical protein U1E53_34960 [Dongiaceae bacterium]
MDLAEAYELAGTRPVRDGRLFRAVRLLRGLPAPGETTPVPETYDRMIEAKFELVGTIDDIKRRSRA